MPKRVHAQAVGGGGVPSASSGGSSSSGIPPLPAGYNVLYSFVGTGDQTGTTLHDLSGSANNGTLTGTTLPSWTGTGVAFSYTPAGSGSVSLPASLNSDETFCWATYLPPLDQTLYPNGTYTGSPTFIGTSTALKTGGWNVETNQGQSASYILNLYNSGGSVTISRWRSAGFHTYCVVQGLTSNSTLDHIYVDGSEAQYTANHSHSGGSQTTGNFLLGRTAFGALTATFYYFVAWPGQLTPAQAIQANYSIASAVAQRGVAVTPPTPPQYSNYFYAVGDSITLGFGLSSPSTQAWPKVVTLPSANGFTVAQNGIFGISAYDSLGESPWRDIPYCSSSSGKTTAIVYLGINDFGQFFTASQVFEFLQSYAATLRSAGCNVGVGTMISQGSLDADKNLLNPLLRQGVVQGNYFLVDFASDPRVGADGASTNTTYFQADKTHPTAAGQAVLAAEASNALASALGVTSANPTVQSANSYAMASGDNFVVQVPTAAATITLPDCLGVTGNVYTITNQSTGANTITVTGLASEAITGTATIAQNATGRFRATLISQAAAGCGWSSI